MDSSLRLLGNFFLVLPGALWKNSAGFYGGVLPCIGCLQCFGQKTAVLEQRSQKEIDTLSATRQAVDQAEYLLFDRRSGTGGDFQMLTLFAVRLFGSAGEKIPRFFWKVGA